MADGTTADSPALETPEANGLKSKGRFVLEVVSTPADEPVVTPAATPPGGSRPGSGGHAVDKAAGEPPEGILLASTPIAPRLAVLSQAHDGSGEAAGDVAAPLGQPSAYEGGLVPPGRSGLSVSFDDSVEVGEAASEAAAGEEEEKVGRFTVANLNNSRVARADLAHAPTSYQRSVKDIDGGWDVSTKGPILIFAVHDVTKNEEGPIPSRSRSGSMALEEGAEPLHGDDEDGMGAGEDAGRTEDTTAAVGASIAAATDLDGGASATICDPHDTHQVPACGDSTTEHPQRAEAGGGSAGETAEPPVTAAADGGMASAGRFQVTETGETVAPGLASAGRFRVDLAPSAADPKAVAAKADAPLGTAGTDLDDEGAMALPTAPVDPDVAAVNVSSQIQQIAESSRHLQQHTMTQTVPSTTAGLEAQPAHGAGPAVVTGGTESMTAVAASEGPTVATSATADVTVPVTAPPLLSSDQPAAVDMVMVLAKQNQQLQEGQRELLHKLSHIDLAAGMQMVSKLQIENDKLTKDYNKQKSDNAALVQKHNKLQEKLNEAEKSLRDANIKIAELEKQKSMSQFGQFQMGGQSMFMQPPMPNSMNGAMAGGTAQPAAVVMQQVNPGQMTIPGQMGGTMIGSVPGVMQQPSFSMGGLGQPQQMQAAVGSQVATTAAPMSNVVQMTQSGAGVPWQMQMGPRGQAQPPQGMAAVAVPQSAVSVSAIPTSAAPMARVVTAAPEPSAFAPVSQGQAAAAGQGPFPSGPVQVHARENAAADAVAESGTASKQRGL
eukprot:CAMPEP_0206302240 /NCGR_PEP_ID=MMETSP0106_2-20121207/8621_1 /ASSEMBLY_ACC=CAM_ASM_000206 /TAXON_ID=81532 /ORGANISM="Acanthoeca-like sp., Strain 10tr" /LENGTH=777 /DNA_ID=CAMNT_0053733001 /DNA_START=308 /DNA_END=2640 /DNA_ORIENTATION=+